MSALRDAITEAMKPRFVSDANPMKDWIKYDGVASKLFAMPEMEAIRSALRDKFVAPNPVGKVDGFSCARGRQLMTQAGLPESVIDWVVET